MWEEGRARRAAVAGEVERGMWRLERQRGRAGSRAFARLRVRGLTVETRYKPDRTAHIASLPDPTASRLTGDVALSISLLLEAGFLYSKILTTHPIFLDYILHSF